MTSKLTDMQLVLLTTACQRDDGSLLPPPAILGTQGGRIRRAVATLIKRHLATECDIADTAKAWRAEGERHIGVVVTDAGRAVIGSEPAAGAEPESGDIGDARANDTTATTATPPVDPAGVAIRNTVQPDQPARTVTKQALVLDMLRQDGGANLDELVAATGWLPHTTRAALTGLRKKGHAISLVGGRGAARYQLTVA